MANGKMLLLLGENDADSVELEPAIKKWSVWDEPHSELSLCQLHWSLNAPIKTGILCDIYSLKIRLGSGIGWYGKASSFEFSVYRK
jgi:hypothetical protein